MNYMILILIWLLIAALIAWRFARWLGGNNVNYHITDDDE